MRRSLGNRLCFGTKSGTARDLVIEGPSFGNTRVRSSHWVAGGKAPAPSSPGFVDGERSAVTMIGLCLLERREIYSVRAAAANLAGNSVALP